MCILSSHSCAYCRRIDIFSYSYKDRTYTFVSPYPGSLTIRRAAHQFSFMMSTLTNALFLASTLTNLVAGTLQSGDSANTFVLQLATPLWSNGKKTSDPVQYVGSSGYGTDNAHLAMVWTIINGQLASLTEGGYISAPSLDGGPSPIPLAPSSRMNAISSGFGVSSDSTLQWTNSLFPQGSANFCQQKSDSAIMSYCGNAPDGCVESHLVAVSPALAVTTAASPLGMSSNNSALFPPLPPSQGCHVGTGAPATFTPIHLPKMSPILSIIG